MNQKSSEQQRKRKQRRSREKLLLKVEHTPDQRFCGGGAHPGLTATVQQQQPNSNGLTATQLELQAGNH